MSTVVYPGTFNPITNGHVDIIQRAAAIFDQVIVAVATSKRKAPLFSLEQRVEMIEQSFAELDLQNVQVNVMENLLVDFAKQHNATCILRGLRAVSDFDYEFQLAGMNRSMAPEIETVFLPANERHAFVSATIVREIISLGGDVSMFVPKPVLKYL